MKKVISVFLAVCMLFGAMQTLGFTVFAETSDFYEYEIIYDEETDSYYAEITGVDESISGDVTIPSTLGSYPVKSIGEWSFGSCRDIESIVFPNSVMKIGYNAFWNCAGLKSVTIPSSIVEISGSPFPNCWQLPEINVDESNGYFTSVDGVLFDKSKIRLIQYPAGKLDANYIIPDGTEIIGTNAFEGSYYLKNVTVCNSVNSIEDGAFTRCYELIGVKFPDNMENWGSHVFYDCQALRNVKIPKGIKSIYQYTFYRCYSLTSVIIPSSVTSIEEDSAFLYCNMLTDIYYDGNEEQWNNIINCLGEELSCFDDTTIHYNSEGPDLSNPQEFLKYEVSENKAVITECINREVEEIIIPQTLGGYTVVGIGSYAFESCNDLVSVSIPDTVTNIGVGAFSYCKSLTSVTIPDSVTSVGSEAFYNCESLSNIVVSDIVEYIGTNAFYNTAYYNDESNWENNILYIGNHLIESNNNSSEEITIKSGTITIADYAFKFSDLTSISMPDSIKNLGCGAFFHCSNLKEIRISKNVSSISLSCFVGCKNLKSVYLPESLIGIDMNAFGNCQSIENISIPETVTYIDDSAFYNCNELKSIVIPDSVKYIGWYALGYIYDETNDSIEKVKDFTIYGTTGSVAEEYANRNGFKFVTEQICKNHVYDNGNVTTAATCRDEGVKTYTCTICGETKTEVIAKLATHTYDSGKVTKAATCKETGIKTYTCTVCKTIKTETIAKLKTHTYDIGKVTKAATCKATGTKTYTCTVCSKTKTETIPKSTKHTYKDVVTKATTSKNGKIENKCSVCGKVNKTTTIYAAKSVALKYTATTYTGKALKPAVTVKDSKGKVIDSKYYTVKYTNNTNVGKATVTVTLKGNYSGTFKATFKINPKGTSLSNINAKSKGFIAKWKKQATQTTGYQIQYSTSSKFTDKTTKMITVKDAKTVSKTISGLKGNTKYYVRIRTYKTVSKANYYSIWSASKTVTTKK